MRCWTHCRWLARESWYSCTMRLRASTGKELMLWFLLVRRLIIVASLGISLGLRTNDSEHHWVLLYDTFTYKNWLGCMGPNKVLQWLAEGVILDGPLLANGVGTTVEYTLLPLLYSSSTTRLSLRKWWCGTGTILPPERPILYIELTQSSLIPSEVSLIL